MNEPRPVAKLTPDIVAEQLDKLKRLFPEAITEGEGGPRVDFDRLRATLGDLDALAGDDAYTFTWAGKQEAFRAIQTPSAASLQPVPEESVNWDTTKHLFIEGENLEVLKLLYKSYVGKVKAICIDPPYNTGNDFIYRDDYREPLQAYLEKTGQIDAAGNVLTSNPETRGRFHSDWLTMMYPRLFLARQLLRDDGVIFVCIDDNEVYHLRLLMNEIFGEENHLGTFVWKSRQMVDNRTKTGISVDHEYVISYGKSPDATLRGGEKDLAKFSNPDNDPRGPWRSADLTGLATKDRRPNLHYDLQDPETGSIYPCPPKGWRYDRDTMQRKIADGRVIFPIDGRGRPRHKLFMKEMDSLFTGLSTVNTSVHTTHGTKDMLDLFGQEVMQFPKPVELLRMLIDQAASDEDVVLDFFAGSGTTAQAVLDLNRQDDAGRRFILVQLPEPTPQDSPARRLGLSTVADIAKERVRRVIEQGRKSESTTHDEGPESQLTFALGARPEEAIPPPVSCDAGFKVFRLAPSTFRHWTPPANASAAALEQQLSYFDAGLQDRADPLHVLYEVLLKEGYSLNSTIATLTVGANTIYRITDEASASPELKGLASEEATPQGGTGPLSSSADAEPPSFYLCLDDAIAPEALDALPLDDETVFICQDAALDDSQKVNLALQCVLKTI